MFKKYKIEWEEDDGRHSVDFFVNSKSTRSGFLHRACVIGCLPRLDSNGNDWSEYRINDQKLMENRVAQVRYTNRTWESYSGQTCLSKLWNRLSKLKFLDMGRASRENPFEDSNEPPHEDLWEPDELFNGFRGR